MTGDRGTTALIVCDGAPIPEEVQHRPWTVRREITTRDPDGKVNLVVSKLADKLGGRLDPRVQDLIRLASYCFAADQAVGRTGIDVHRERWRREMTLCVGVADPACWTDPAVMEALRETLGFLTDDTWHFVFSQLPPAPEQISVDWDRREGFAQPDRIVLFSGGLDSLCALVEAVQEGAHPVLVSHWPAQHIRMRQQRLRMETRDCLACGELPHVSIETHRAGEGDGERTQRTRGFLFVALGAAVAAHLGVRNVILADNGYVSLNPPINDQLVGALASRGTHPKSLFLVNRLVDHLFEGAVQVTNPLWDRTRAEAVTVLRQAGCADLVHLTYSCGKHRHMAKGKTHCGTCTQCLDRRVALIKAGLEEHDPVDHYEADCFTSELPAGEPQLATLSYFRFADAVNRLDADQVVEAYPELGAAVHPDDPEFMERLLAMTELLQRHAEETLSVMAVMLQRHAPDLARRTLSPQSLLRLWVRGDATSEEVSQTSATYGVAESGPTSRVIRYRDVVFLEFRHERHALKALTGIRRVLRLLQQPGEEIEALDLAAETTRSSHTARQGIGGVTASDEVLRESRQGDAGTILDQPAIRDLRKRRDQLLHDIRLAESQGNQQQAANLQGEVRWIDVTLKGALGLGGKLRAIPEEHERARNTVSTTIRGDVKKLESAMPMLHAHLRAWVHTGYLCWYKPDPPERWEITAQDTH